MSGVSVRPGAFLLLLAVALAGAGSAAALVIVGEERGAGVAVAVAGGALLGASIPAGRSPRLLLLEAVTERAVEAAVLGAIAWVALPETPWQAAAAVTALGASYLMTYFRLRSAALGFRMPDLPVLRVVPVFVVALGLITGLVQIALLTAAGFAILILEQEIAAVARQRERR